MLEKVDEFGFALDYFLKESQVKYHLRDASIAWCLLRMGTDYYFKSTVYKEWLRKADPEEPGQAGGR